jgi:hypothetical protein
MTMKRQCYHILADQRDENGYIPSLVTEDTPGHQPLSGAHPGQRPWYWGKTYDEARKTCARVNAEQFGLTETQASQIVLSSMRAGRVKGSTDGP